MEKWTNFKWGYLKVLQGVPFEKSQKEMAVALDKTVEI